MTVLAILRRKVIVTPHAHAKSTHAQKSPSCISAVQYQAFRQVFYMQPVPEAMRVKKLTNQQFRLGILAFYPAHIVASYFLTVYICHTSAKAKNMQNNSFTHTVPTAACFSNISFYPTGKAF